MCVDLIELLDYFTFSALCIFFLGGGHELVSVCKDTECLITTVLPIILMHTVLCALLYSLFQNLL